MRFLGRSRIENQYPDKGDRKNNFEPVMEVDAKYEDLDTQTVQRYGRKLMAALAAGQKEVEP